MQLCECPPRTVLAAALMLALPPAAHAVIRDEQDLARLSFEELAEIDVSAASLLRASLLDAGSSISSITAREWRRAGARRMMEALEQQVGALVLPHTSGNQVLAVRGYARSTSYTGTATSWDDVPLNDLFRSAPQFNLPSVNLGALSQIQLIQGPGSALYGSDAFHGMIALRSAAAGQDDDAVTMAYGSDGYAETSLRHGVIWVDGLRLGVALAANCQPGQERPAAWGGSLDGTAPPPIRALRYGAQTGTVKLASNPEQALSWFGGLYWHRYRADEFQGSGTRLSGGNDLGWLDTDFTMGQGGVRWQASADRSLEAKAYYWHVDNTLSSNLRSASGTIHRDLLTRQHRAGVQATYRDAIPAWHTELAFALGNEWLGVDVAKAYVSSLAGAPLSTVVNPAEGANRNVRSATLEMVTSWDQQRWRLVYGGRLDDYSDVGRHASPRAGLIYHPRPDTALKLLVGEAFRAPSAVERGGAAGSVLGNPSLKPETIRSYELVALHQDEHKLVQMTVFRTFWQDGIAAVLAPPQTLSQYRNVERSDAHGVTASAKYQRGGWLLEANGSLVRSRNSGTGVEYSIFPRTMFSAVIGRALSQAWDVQLRQRWQARTNDIPSTEGFPTQTLPRFSRTDVTLAWQASSRSELALQLRNVMNRANRVASAPASRGGIPDEPFSASLQWQYRY